MVGVRAAAVSDEVAGDAAAVRVEQEETRLGRRLGEIDDADHVDLVERGTMPVEGGAGAGDEARIDDRIDHHAAAGPERGGPALNGSVTAASSGDDITASAPAAAPASIICRRDNSILEYPPRSDWEPK